MFLQALLHSPAPRTASPARVAARPAAALSTDDALRLALLQRLRAAPWWDERTANVFVDDGVVVYQGLRRGSGDPAAARRVALGLPGVRGVWDARVPRREWQAMA